MLALSFQVRSTDHGPLDVPSKLLGALGTDGVVVRRAFAASITELIAGSFRSAS